MKAIRLIAIGIAAGLLAGCGRRETAADAGIRTGVLLLGNGAEPQALDPQIVTGYPDYNVVIALFEGLTCVDERTSQAVPGAAERWEVSQDGLVYTFHLRPGLRWSNGDPLTADDFVYSFHRALSPALASEYSYLLYPIKNAESFNANRIGDFAQVGVRAPDPRTVEITLGHRCPYLPILAALPAWSPVHRATIEKFGPMDRRGTAWANPGNMVGNGPFVLKEWTPNSRIVVARNPYYWDDAHNGLQSVVFFPNDNTAVDENNFRTGQLHVTFDLPTERIAHYRSEDPGVLRMDPFCATRFIRFNVTRPPLSDPRVRRALGMAIDREAIARDVLYGSRAPAYSLIPPDTGGYTSSARMPADYDAARRLLAEAGYPGGKNFPRLQAETFADPINAKVLEAIQQMWHRELGVDVSLVSEDFRVWLDNLHKLSYQISFTRWVGDYNDPSTFLNQFKGDSGNNMTGWASASYDRLNDSADRELDAAKRRALLQSAESLLLQEAPIAPVFYDSRTYLIRPEVKGWVPSLLGVHRYQYVRLEKVPNS